MSGAGFTPGPWSVEGSIYDGMAAAILSPTDPSGPTNTVAHILNGSGSFANARLIAAAPELYEALEKAAPFIGWASTRDQIIAGVRAEELCDVIDAALAKARGETA